MAAVEAAAAAAGGSAAHARAVAQADVTGGRYTQADVTGGRYAQEEAHACAAAQASSALHRRPVPAPLDDLDDEPRDASGHAAVTIARAVADPTARGKDADPLPDTARRAGTALDGARPVRRVSDGSAAAAAAVVAEEVDGSDGADRASAVRQSEVGAVRQSEAGAVRQSEAGAVRQSEAGAVVHGLSKWTGKSLSAEMDE